MSSTDFQPNFEDGANDHEYAAYLWPHMQSHSGNWKAITDVMRIASTHPGVNLSTVKDDLTQGLNQTDNLTAICTKAGINPDHMDSVIKLWQYIAASAEESFDSWKISSGLTSTNPQATIKRTAEILMANVIGFVLHESVIKQQGDRYAGEVIDFTKLQSVTPKQIEDWQNIADVQAGHTVLDAMSGPATGSMLLANGARKDFSVTLLDSSETGLVKGGENLTKAGIVVTTIKADFMQAQTAVAEGVRFKRVLIRSALHEIPKDRQVEALKIAASLTSDDGMVIVWQQTMPAQNPNMMRDIIRQRDIVAGNTVQAERRYFPTEAEFLETANKAGLEVVKIQKTDPQAFHTASATQADFKADFPEQLDQFNRYIQQRVPTTERDGIGYKENTMDLGAKGQHPSITFQIPVTLFALRKKVRE